MSQLLSYNSFLEVKDFGFNGQKFIRRPDLSTLDRIHIAHTALMAKQNNYWGIITSLSEQYKVSRTFIYTIANRLWETGSVIFGGKNFEQSPIDRKLPFYHMLSLRMEGRCSLGATSTIMKRFNIDLAATGSISQYLTRFGSFLPNTLTTNSDEIQMVVFLIDEIFSKNTPILVTVDADSSAILRIELANSRKAEEWKHLGNVLRKTVFLPHISFVMKVQDYALLKKKPYRK